MKQDYFQFLPPEIIINILSRIPARTIKSCQCICKSWLGLIETPEFVKSYLSKSVRSLAIVLGKTTRRIVEFVDEIDTQNSAHHFHVVLDFKFPYYRLVHSSANGLLFSFKYDEGTPRNLFIGNPITRECIKLPPPKETSSSDLVIIEHDAFGFGVTKVSGQHKLELAFFMKILTWVELLKLKYRNYASGAFVNGNLHWLVFDPINRPQISCFDLETVLFTSFVPPFPYPSCAYWLSVLEDRLCFCDNSATNQIVIWLKKKEYADENSWERLFSIKRPCYPGQIGMFFPVKVFKNGDILFTLSLSSKLFCYSNKTKTIREREPLEQAWSVYFANTFIFTPSFVSLKTLGMENVRLFSDV